MKIKGKIVNSNRMLIVETEDKAMLETILDNFKDVEVSVEIKKYFQKRSLDQNAKMWAMIDEIASFMRMPITEVYKTAIREVGGNSTTVCAREECVDTFCKAWSNNGLGWCCEVMESKIDGCKNIVCYYGSSTFDTEQMARMIEVLTQDEVNLGILPPPIGEML